MIQTDTNLIGQRFGKLTVAAKADTGGWACICDCGEGLTVPGNVLRKGDRRSCGCASPGRVKIDMTGQIIGDLTVIRQGPAYTAGKRSHITRWWCQCICGKEILVTGYKLRAGDVTSCGCWKSKTIVEQLYTWKKYEALRRPKEFTLSMDEFTELVLQDCHYCGRPPSNIYKGKLESIQYSGLDRKHNDQGYVPGNCLPCCFHCNSMKLDLSYEDFIEKIRLLHSRLCN